MRALSRLRAGSRSLRFRLLVGMLLLVSLGLVGVDLTAYYLLRSYTYGRIDRQLTVLGNLPGSLPGSTQALIQAQQRRRFVDSLEQTMASSGLRLVVFDSQGRMVLALPTADSRAHSIAAAAVRMGLLKTPGKTHGMQIGGVPYRAVFRPARVSDAQTAGVVVALPIATEKESLHELALTEGIASVAALVLLAGLGVSVLRVGLRPLDAMAATASAIAGGDSARRVPVGRPGTETARLAEALNRAFEERQRAEDRVRRFAADASHELRTPLTTIQGWADLYFQGGLKTPAEVETAMSRIADEAGAMRGIVEDLLLLARLDQQRPLEREPVDLAALVRDVVADARVIDPDRPISMELAETEVVVPGDELRLRQVVRNLVGNAVQHTPAGCPVRVGVGRTGDGATVSVADAGPGIPAAAQERLFERFYRDGMTRGGTGLGLAIVQAVVQAHGGSVTVRSELGQGSTFVVALPETLSRSSG